MRTTEKVPLDKLQSLLVKSEQFQPIKNCLRHIISENLRGAVETNVNFQESETHIHSLICSWLHLKGYHMASIAMKTQLGDNWKEIDNDDLREFDDKLVNIASNETRVRNLGQESNMVTASRQANEINVENETESDEGEESGSSSSETSSSDRSAYDNNQKGWKPTRDMLATDKIGMSPQPIGIEDDDLEEIEEVEVVQDVESDASDFSF